MSVAPSSMVLLRRHRPGLPPRIVRIDAQRVPQHHVPGGPMPPACYPMRAETSATRSNVGTKRQTRRLLRLPRLFWVALLLVVTSVALGAWVLAS